MPKKSLEVLLDVSVDRASEVPLHRQVYLGIRRLVLTGRLRPGSRLPSTRQLASDLRLSRTTALDAFEQLIFEGYLEGKVGSGTRVSAHIPRDVQTLASVAQQSPIPTVRRKPRIARPRNHSAKRGQPHQPDRFADPDQVIITTGAQQALYLCAKTLLDPGESVWMEDPGYPRARAAFKSAQLSVVPVLVDSEGLNSAVSSEKRPAPQMIYVTPSFQCPVLSATR